MQPASFERSPHWNKNRASLNANFKLCDEKNRRKGGTDSLGSFPAIFSLSLEVKFAWLAETGENNYKLKSIESLTFKVIVVKKLEMVLLCELKKRTNGYSAKTYKEASDSCPSFSQWIIEGASGFGQFICSLFLLFKTITKLPLHSCTSKRRSMFISAMLR